MATATERVALPPALYELEFNQGSEYGPEEEQAVLEVLRAGAPSCGPRVMEFEAAFAAYCGVRSALSVTSATAGLHLAMLAAGIGIGDEVITTPLSWIATANAAAATGASVVFADIDARTLNLDPASVARKITDRTKAIIPVHLYGQCCDMDALMGLARRRSILVVEDCAHAPGAVYRGRKAGSLGDIGVFSFHQQKNMTTLGEGGMITTSDPKLEERMFSLRSLCARAYGPRRKYLSLDDSARPMGKRYWHFDFDGIGYNFRMTDAQAAVGLAQLKKLDGFNARRAEVAQAYHQRLRGIRGLTLPHVPTGTVSAYHSYCVQIEPEFPQTKEDFMWELYTRKQIKTWSHYMPIHLTTAYRQLGHGEGECPVAEAAFERYVSLPIHPRLTPQAIEYLTDSIREIATRGAR
ncbi:MAG: DegT/DnrJ/EryC1/StrS family aminotransferase [Actinomycetota bacterium]|nr:DegT/DnrJ/EryC1/StrS family aminotransferase [Actinomycetota bacterium]